MQETQKKTSAETREPIETSVVVCIRSSLFVLAGRWTWNLQSAAVYASDVMEFPQAFEGTKGIIHPDDLPNLSSALQLLADGELAALDFRLITTYGEVKNIRGQNISLDSPLNKERNKEEAPWEETLQVLALRREAEALQQRKAIAEKTEKLHRIGSFAINKITGEAWYSDGVFYLYGLPPQSLNAHANTFHSFLHPDDRLPFLDAFDAAFAGELPLHLEYRIQLTDGEFRTLRLVTYWSYNSKGQPIFAGILRDPSEETILAGQVAQATDKAQLHQQVLRFSEQSWNTGYFFIDLVTRKVTYSDNCCRIYGVKSQDLPSLTTFLSLVHSNDRERVRVLMDEMFSEHLLPEAEFGIIRPDGRQRQLKQTGKLLSGASSQVMMGMVQDVTVQRGLEKKVGELNEKLALQEALQGLTENLTETAFITWYARGSQAWSEGFFRLLGYKPGSTEPTPRLVHSQIHPDDVKAFKEAETLIANGQPHDGLRFRIINRNGIRQLHITFHRLGSEKEETVIGVVRDLTKEEAVQRKLADAAHYTKVLETSISDMVFLTDTENMVLSWNRAAGEKTGIRSADAIYTNLFDLFPRLADEAYTAHLHTAWRGTEVQELKARGFYLRKVHHFHLIPLKNEKGEIHRMLHVVQDVSKELELQQQLTERLNFIESLVEASVDRIVVLDRHMNYVYWNRKAEEYYAVAKEKVIGRNILELFPGLHNDPDYGEFRKVLRGETIYLPPTLVEESTEYFETYLIPVKDERDEVSAILWIVHDLSNELQLQLERRKAQAQLTEEHRRLKEAQAIGHVGSFEWIATSDTIYWSDEMYRIHGLEPQSEVVTFERVTSFIHPDDLEATYEKIVRCRNVACTLEIKHRIVRADGEVRFICCQIQSFADSEGAITHLSGTLQDITEQKQAEEKIKEQSHFLQRILETSPDMISIIDLDTRQTHYLNEEAFAANGFDAKYITSKSPEEQIEVIYPDDRQTLADYFQRLATATDEEINTAEYRAINIAGEWGWFFVRGKVFRRNAAGQVTQILNVIENITERKKAAQEILWLKDEIAQTATDKYLTLFNAIDEGFYLAEVLVDGNNRPVDVFYHEENPAAIRILGESIKGKKLTEINPDHEKFWFDIYVNVVANGESKRLEQYAQQYNKWFNFYITRIGDENSRQAAVIFQDITQQKLHEHRQQFLLKLDDVIRSVSDPIKIEETVTALSMDYFKADRCFYCEILGDDSIVSRDAAHEGLPSVAGVYSWRNAPIWKSLIDKGKHIVVEDVHISDIVDESLKQLCIELDVISFLDVPVIKDGKPQGVLCLTQNTPRTWAEADISLASEIAERTWAAVQRARVETNLRQSEEQLKGITATLEKQIAERTADLQRGLTILQSAEGMAQMGSWEYDINSGNFKWSDGMYRLFGLPQGSHVKPEIYLDFASEEDRSVARRIVKNLKKGQQSFEEKMQIKRGGDVRLLKVKGLVVTGETGKPQRMVGVDLDITDIQQAEQKLEESRHLIEQTALASPDAIIIYDLAKKQPVYLNNCLAEWIGTTTDELLGMGIEGRLLLIHPDDRLRLLHFNEKIKAAKDGTLLTLEYRLRTKQDNLLWIRSRSKVFRRNATGEVTHILTILQDVTEEKGAEQALNDLNASLEKKNLELLSKNEEITSFAFVASHDLREPLRKIYTFSDWLMTREAGLTESGKQTIEKMNSAVKRLEQLIDDILALTKVHVDNERSKAVDLNALLQRLQGEMHEMLHQAGTVIDVGRLPILYGAENQLFYLFKNLIGNAIKFQPKDQQPLITIRAESEGRYIKVSVTDNGIGISPEYHKKIFEMFRRLHGRQEYEGAGMGLPICKKIMEKHGGLISVKSEEGKGAAFICWFPEGLVAH